MRSKGHLNIEQQSQSCHSQAALIFAPAKKPTSQAEASSWRAHLGKSKGGDTGGLRKELREKFFCQDQFLLVQVLVFSSSFLEDMTFGTKDLFKVMSQLHPLTSHPQWENEVQKDEVAYPRIYGKCMSEPQPEVKVTSVEAYFSSTCERPTAFTLTAVT